MDCLYKYIREKFSISTFTIVLLAFTPEVSQSQEFFEGKVIDSTTNAPVVFANIGFEGRGIGTITDESGSFSLQTSISLEARDTLRISSLGYRTLKIPYSIVQNSSNQVIRLASTPLELDEVLLLANAKYTVEEQAGYPLGNQDQYVEWDLNRALGAELSSRIRVGKGRRRLNALFFSTMELPADSLLLRINFYEYNGRNGEPGINLNNSGKEILYSLNNLTNSHAVDLNDYDLFVTDDFIVSLELLRVFGAKQPVMRLPAKRSHDGVVWRKYASQGSWDNLGEYDVGFYLQTTFSTDNKRKAENRKVNRKLERLQRRLNGYIFNGRSKVVGAEIINMNTNTKTESGPDGRFEILALPGDFLKISPNTEPPLVIKVLESGAMNINLQNYHRRK